MADANSTRARGIQVQRYAWGLWAKGARDLLIKHGFAQPGPWPGDPGERKTTVHATDPQGRPIRIRRESKLLFSIHRQWSDAEAESHLEDEARKKKIEQASKLVESWPKSAAGFRDSIRAQVDMAARMLELMLGDGERGGYRYDDDALFRLQLITDQLRALAATGGIVKDMALRDKHTPACIANAVRAADAAKHDKTFQRFLAGMAK